MKNFKRNIYRLSEEETTTTTTTAPISYVYFINYAQDGGASNSSTACSPTTIGQVWSTRNNINDITISDVLYNDAGLSSQFNGNLKWYGLATSYGASPVKTVQPTTFGVITSTGTCSVPTTTTSSSTSTTSTSSSTTTTTTTTPPTYTELADSRWGSISQASTCSNFPGTLYSNCEIIEAGVGCIIYTDTSGTPLLGNPYVYLQQIGSIGNWDVNPSTGEVTNYAPYQC
jgi:hypothetical protein